MIPEDHPYYFLEPLFAREGASFNFSRYVYTPDSLFDDRENIRVLGSDISVEWLEDSLNSLRDDQELAIHSTVTIEGRTSHIPMIDFSTPTFGAKELDRLRAFIPQRIFMSSSFYKSGRSFHGYSTNLLAPRDWLEFLGRLLLVNLENGPNVVDSRWIGHRLIAGYCSLRFSNNSEHYLGMPRNIKVNSLVDQVIVVGSS